MSDLLAPLLVTFGEPADAYWALDALIKRSAAVICPRDDVMDVQLVSEGRGLRGRAGVCVIRVRTAGDCCRGVLCEIGVGVGRGALAERTAITNMQLNALTNAIKT